MGVTSVMGAFVSNTGTVAIMIPIVVSMAMSVKMNPSRVGDQERVPYRGLLLP